MIILVPTSLHTARMKILRLPDPSPQESDNTTFCTSTRVSEFFHLWQYVKKAHPYRQLRPGTYSIILSRIFFSTSTRISLDKSIHLVIFDPSSVQHRRWQRQERRALPTKYQILLDISSSISASSTGSWRSILFLIVSFYSSQDFPRTLQIRSISLSLHIQPSINISALILRSNVRANTKIRNNTIHRVFPCNCVTCPNSNQSWSS